MARIYTDLPDELLTRIENYRTKIGYNPPRNNVIIALLDEALKEKGY